MKHIILLFSATIVCGLSNGQAVKDSVTLGAGYQNQSYYSLSQGEVGNADNSDWDLAFDVSAQGYAIRTNDVMGAELYQYPDGGISDWETLDTSGLSGWSLLYNSDTSWSTGAFNRYEADLDVGWGNYSTTTHDITGDSLYVIKTVSGQWRKLWIEQLSGGVYTFKYAGLDGSFETEVTLDKSDYSGVNFAYFSFDSEGTTSREPDAGTWDIVFTKYMALLAPGVYYGVTGALTNKGIGTGEARGVDVDDAAYGDYPFASAINVIGYDWKSFNMDLFQYELEDSLCYFVNDHSGGIWKLVFTAFEGSSTGKIVFKKEQLVASVPDTRGNTPGGFAIYPNPSDGAFNLLFNLNHASNAAIAVYDISGKQVYGRDLRGVNGLNNERISIPSMQRGIYIVSLKSGETLRYRRLIVR